MDISAPMSVPATPVPGNINCTGTSTGTGMVTNTLVIGLSSVLAVCIIIIGVQLIFIVAAVLYIKRMNMLHKGSCLCCIFCMHIMYLQYRKEPDSTDLCKHAV